MLAACLVLCPLRASGDSDRVELARDAPPGVEPSTPNAPNAAKIVLVGTLGEDEELVLLFRELLERQGVASSVTRASSFEREALFTDRDDGREVRVFVTLPGFYEARLYFRGPLGDRFLLRRLTLASGLDAIGREHLGQVVESSVAALLRSSEGLSREQATREIAREVEPRETPGARPARGAPERAPSPPPKRVERELHADARYALSWPGGALGLAHGPGVLLGLRFRSRPSLGFELGAERFFSQTLTAGSVEADVQRTSLHALCELGLPFAGAHGMGLAFGPAIELSRIRPSAGPVDVTLASPSTDTAPALRLELRYALGVGHVLFGAAALLDLGLVRSHYDLAEAGVRRELAAPWLARPGAAVSIGVR